MKYIFSILIILLFLSCKEKLPVIDSFKNSDFQLVNQNGASKSFPDVVRGKTTVVGFIFTNCPDICPLTTNNMRLIQEQLKKEQINELVEFVSISFDTQNDNPEVLKKFAEIRNLDLTNWNFYTGNKETIDSLLLLARVIAVPTDSTIYSDGKKTYYFTHTDRIQLVDAEGQIRKNYSGSKINIEEIVIDIKTIIK
jgi:protein SCO1/2